MLYKPIVGYTREEYVWKTSKWIFIKKKKESYCILFSFFDKKETNVIVLILRKCLKHFNNVSWHLYRNAYKSIFILTKITIKGGKKQNQIKRTKLYLKV